MKPLAVIGVVALAVLANSAQADRWIADPRGQDLRSFCDLHDKATMSQECLGFVSAVVEITLEPFLFEITHSRHG